MAGATTVVSAIQGFAGPGGVSPETVDHQGNHHLIEAARASGVEHVVLMSIHGAAPDHPLELFRMKGLAEEELLDSGLAWTIIRPTAYMETWLRLVGEPLARTGKTRIFGRGENPINLVSAHDVARYVALAVTDPALRGATVDVGGPENLTMRQVVETVERVTGATGKVGAVPLPAMRLMGRLTRRLKPDLARQIETGIYMDTADMTFDPAPTLATYPSIPLTTLEEVIRRDLTGKTEA